MSKSGKSVICYNVIYIQVVINMNAPMAPENNAIQVAIVNCWREVRREGIDLLLQTNNFPKFTTSMLLLVCRFVQVAPSKPNSCLLFMFVCPKSVALIRPL
ncbi:hypothetical protein PIB30_040406 [Stylosanthes scabra]|uniref:Uncharacterized protein n=1 Tax=Stylosanthes scabra TaxID=79078 RepID=A0ABU6REN2_9FABA|nr:hypothetical protein [Stylosanthes scabra]